MNGITFDPTLISILLFYGQPLLAHISSRIGKELNQGVDKIFDKLTKLLPWKKSKPKTQKEAQIEIEKKLQDNPQLQDKVDALLKELQAIEPQLSNIVREYHNKQLQYIDNRNAHIGKQINVEKVEGDINIH